MSITKDIKACIGLGNPGHTYYNQRHSIGFRVLDALADQHGAQWRTKDRMEVAEILLNDHKVLLIKPQTFMNNSGAILPFLTKQGIKAENILVVHDELELPFGKLASKQGGSAKGHNGLKSIITACGENFYRLRFGIGRPAQREDVPDYVLQPFAEPADKVDQLIEQAATMIEGLF